MNKKTLSILAFLWLTHISFCFSKEPNFFCFINDYYNPYAKVLYKGYTHHIFIDYKDFENYDDEENISFYVTCNGAKIQFYGEEYILDNINSDQVKINVYNGKDSSLITSFDFKVLRFPRVICQLGYLKKKEVTINEVLNQNELILLLGDSYIKTDDFLFHYRIKVISEKGEIVAYYLAGKIDDRFKNVIKNLKAGSRIIFYPHHVSKDGSDGYGIAPVEYKIVN